MFLSRPLAIIAAAVSLLASPMIYAIGEDAPLPGDFQPPRQSKPITKPATSNNTVKTEATRTTETVRQQKIPAAKPQKSSARQRTNARNKLGNSRGTREPTQASSTRKRGTQATVKPAARKKASNAQARKAGTLRKRSTSQITRKAATTQSKARASKRGKRSEASSPKPRQSAKSRNKKQVKKAATPRKRQTGQSRRHS